MERKKPDLLSSKHNRVPALTQPLRAYKVTIEFHTVYTAERIQSLLGIEIDTHLVNCSSLRE